MKQVVLATLATLSAHAALAAEITFDAAPSGTVVGDTYAPLGVVFNGATVENLTDAGIATSTPPNAAVDADGPFMSFSFTDTLPDYVSFTVSTAARDSVEAFAVTSTGTTLTAQSGGAAGPASTPYIPNDLLVFAGADIEKVTLYDFFDLRADIAMDTLTYTPCCPNLPEPATWLLLAAPLLALTIWRPTPASAIAHINPCNTNRR